MRSGKELDYAICNQILEIDKSIRFAAFVNNMGTIIAAQHRELLSVEKEKDQSLLTKDELELSAIESVLRSFRKSYTNHTDVSNLLAQKTQLSPYFFIWISCCEFH